MENRRQHYRHEFAPTRIFLVRLESAEGTSVLDAELINLSIGGMCVYASAFMTETAEKWSVALPLEECQAPLTVPSQRVYLRDASKACCGFRFLAGDDQHGDEEREKVIWRFLLNEQRRRRRFLQGG